MKQHRYPVDARTQLRLKDVGVSPIDVLRHAHLPLDLFTRTSPTVTGPEYLRLWSGLEAVLRDQPSFPLDLATSSTPETFSPPVFACFCSPNLLSAAQRLAHYKPLVGPIRLEVETSDEQTTIQIAAQPDVGALPPSLMAGELAWWVHMPRLATRERLVPLRVQTTGAIPGSDAYEDFFGVRLTRSDVDSVTFSASDALRPFLTASDAMWSIFEPELRQRMADLDRNATTTEKVRASLLETLAGGRCRVDDVASRLAVSPRTLQRRLQDEGTSFQQILDAVRKELAGSYLARSDFSNEQIAFLLGYEDPSSFFRAFRAWTGRTPEASRALAPL